MEAEQAKAYRNQVKKDIKGLPYSEAKWWNSELKKEDPNYDIARSTARERHAFLPEQQRLDEAVFSQPVVQNPLLEIPVGDADLSDEQKTVVWATQKQAKFEQLQKDSTQKRKITGFVESLANELLSDPRQLNGAARVWKASTVASEPGRTCLYGVLKKEISRKLRRAEALPDGLVSELVRAYTYGDEVAELSQAALKAYFHDRGKAGNVDTLYNFALAVFDLIDDPLAFEKGLLIANFEDEGILQRGSNLYTDFLIGRNSLDDDNVLRKMRRFGICFDALVLTSVDTDAVARRNIAFDSNPKLKEKSYRYLQHVASKLSFEEVNRRLHLLNATQDSLEPMMITREDRQRLLSEWPISVVYDDTDPLSQKYRQVAESKVSSMLYRNQVVKSMAEEGVTSFTFLSIPLPEGAVVEVCIGGEMDQERRAALVRKITREGVAFFHERQSEKEDFSGGVMTGEKGILGNNSYRLWLRHAIFPERQRHPLSGLEAVGLPAPKLEGDESLGEAVSRLHHDLLTGHIRFINRRGFSIPIPSQELRKLGYQTITFRGTDRYRILVKVAVNNVIYPIKLDPNFSLDLEGKKPLSPVLDQTFSYLVYSLLKPIICEARDHSGVSGLEAGNLDVVSRVGHFRELTMPGFHYSTTAIGNCFREQGKDLVAEQGRLQNRPGQQTNNPFTYVRELIETGEDLPPQEFRISVIPGFN